MAETRRLTLISLSLALDREMTRVEFEALVIPEIRKMCSFKGDKYAPEICIDSLEYRNMEIIPRGGNHGGEDGKDTG